MRHTLLALVLLLAGTAPASAQRGQGFEDLVSRYANFGFRGAVLVAKKGKVLLAKGFGIADPKTKRKNTADTLFEIASITKQITATAILRLEQDGKLKVEDSIAKHLPGVPEHSRKITIHHLLTHTSGVPGANTKGQGDNLERAVIDYLGRGPQRPLGQKWEYWNGGYALLAGVVERASRMSFMDYCHKHLFAPAGMKETGFTGSKKLNAKRAAFNEGRTAIDHPYGSYGWQYRGMGGAVTTLGDLLKWHKALAGDTLLGGGARKKLFAPHVGGRQAHGRGYGYGWFVGRAPDGSTLAQHGGSVRGFRSDLRRYPKIDGCIAILSNGDGMVVPYIAENLEGLLFGKKPRHKLPPATDGMSAKELKPYAGTYSGKNGEAIVIAVVGSDLTVKANGGIAGTLVGDPSAKEASFPIRPLRKNKFLAWSWRRELPFEFVRKGRKVRSLRVGGLSLKR